MNNKTSREFVAHGILPRLIIAFCLFVGITSVWVWQPTIKQNPTRFLVHIPKEPPEQQTLTENRDLSAYERGADFSNCTYGALYGSNRSIQQCENERDKGRDFIWKHWKNKKRGYIVYEVTGSDSAADIHIFIEPDKNGTWHIIQRWRRDNPYMKLNAYYEIASTNATFIKHKRAITEDEIESLGKIYLSFLDKDGKEVNTL